MGVPESPEGALYREYRRGIEGEPLARSLRIAVIVLFVIQTVFIGVDWLVFPEMFARFLPVRLGLNVVLAVIYFGTAHRYPIASSYATYFAGGAMLLAVTDGTGGAASGYYVGLVLLFIGIGVLSPLSGRQAALGTSVLFATYALLPFLREAPIPWDPFGLHLFFLAAAGFEGVMSCFLLDRMRFSDFKQRREIEEARDQLKQLDREKSRFTANVHHELRTPLTLMLAPLDAMLGGDFGAVPPLQRGYLETMHTNAQRLLKLINNLLDLSKIEGDQLRLTRRPSRLAELVGALIAGARPLAERKGVALEARGFDALPLVHIDAGAVDKVLVNLVGNALKFTDRGGRIEVIGEPAPDGGVHVVVSDTGAGLPADQLERIFDRFAQVDASATRRHEGTGIGLSLAKELVELHGGRIWAESDGVGRGARLHLTLPVGEADAEAEEAVLATDGGQDAGLGTSIRAMAADAGLDSERPLVELHRTVERSESAAGAGDTGAELPEGPAGAPEVLVVEDNTDMRRLLAFLLSREFRVRVARNGREALEAVREREPELILTDVMMPEMSGTELCRVIKADPATEGIPVVLVTSKAEREMKLEGLELGADDYVTKPFHPRELMARVRSLVHLRRLQEVLAERNALLERANEDLETALAELKEASTQLAQAAQLAAVGELAAGVAHEVNNPINFATNALQTLRRYVADVRCVAEQAAAIDWSDPDRARRQAADLEALGGELDLGAATAALEELVGIVVEGLDRTRRLVGDLRDFAAPPRGAVAEVDVGAGIESTLQLMRYAMRQAGAEVETELDEEVARVPGNARALNQVFLNLLKNATEAVEGAGGVVGVRLRQEGDRVVIEVRDDGPGIPAANQERLFEPFFSTKGAGRGTGLGLSICRRIVSEHGGSIGVESSEGSGTTFTVRLPACGGDRAA
jgi:signal transduction histidine kinase